MSAINIVLVRREAGLLARLINVDVLDFEVSGRQDLCRATAQSNGIQMTPSVLLPWKTDVIAGCTVQMVIRNAGVTQTAHAGIGTPNLPPHTIAGSGNANGPRLSSRCTAA